MSNLLFATPPRRSLGLERTVSVSLCLAHARLKPIGPRLDNGCWTSDRARSEKEGTSERKRPLPARFLDIGNRPNDRVLAWSVSPRVDKVHSTLATPVPVGWFYVEIPRGRSTNTRKSSIWDRFEICLLSESVIPLQVSNYSSTTFMTEQRNKKKRQKKEGLITDGRLHSRGDK